MNLFHSFDLTKFKANLKMAGNLYNFINIIYLFINIIIIINVIIIIIIIIYHYVLLLLLCIYYYCYVSLLLFNILLIKK